MVDFRLTWLSFLIFTALHVFANLKAVKAVTMKTLNRTRYLIVLKQYVSTLSIPSVQETNRLEPVVMGLISSGNLSTQIIYCGSFKRLNKYNHFRKRHLRL